MKNDSTPSPPLLSTLGAGDIATILGISRSSAYTLLHSRSGPPVLRVGKLLRVPQESFWAWVKENTSR